MHPGIGGTELHILTSRHIAPLAVAPTWPAPPSMCPWSTRVGRELDLGTAIDATPEQSGGRCYFAADGISREARANRDLLGLHSSAAHRRRTGGAQPVHRLGCQG